MRWRITIRDKGTELRGYMDFDHPHQLEHFSDLMRSYGLVIASPAEDDYDPFAYPIPERDNT